MFPNMGAGVREFVESCLPCQSVQARAETDCRSVAGISRRIKRTIGKEYYLHVLINQYSKFPVVQVVKSTSWEHLKSGLEEAFATNGIQEKITMDGGLPYSGHEFAKNCKSMRVDHHMTTAEDAPV